VVHGPTTSRLSSEQAGPEHEGETQGDPEGRVVEDHSEHNAQHQRQDQPLGRRFYSLAAPLLRLTSC
jgi:hypothetical protein